MSSYPIARKIRARKLSLLLNDARSTARRTQEECAQILGISLQQYQSYEQGVQSPSLPELELLAYYWDVSLDHFWGSQALSASRPAKDLANANQIIALRQFALGEKLREARTLANLSSAELAEKTAIPEDVLSGFESGQAAMSVPELETVASELKMHMDDFLDQESPAGQWRVREELVHKFLDLSPEMQQFVTQPVNRPYVELAQRLSGLSVERLRAIAEGLLEITF